VPVCYDADLGPDLDHVAAHARLDRDTVIALHTGRTYCVFMLGFVPGFAYLGTIDPRLTLPRRQNPRPAVEPGSVAIAGEQTAVYPSRTPGGWHIIGRTPLKMFVPERPESSLLEAGDVVRFAAIDRREFVRIAAAQGLPA
jgi:inhibitor of KinA